MKYHFNTFASAQLHSDRIHRNKLEINQRRHVTAPLDYTWGHRPLYIYRMVRQYKHLYTQRYREIDDVLDWVAA